MNIVYKRISSYFLILMFIHYWYTINSACMMLRRYSFSRMVWNYNLEMFSTSIWCVWVMTQANTITRSFTFYCRYDCGLRQPPRRVYAQPKAVYIYTLTVNFISPSSLFTPECRNAETCWDAGGWASTGHRAPVVHFPNRRIEERYEEEMVVSLGLFIEIEISIDSHFFFKTWSQSISAWLFFSWSSFKIISFQVTNECIRAYF